MVNLSNIELSEICNHLGKSNLRNTHQVFGGCIHDSWRIDFQDSRYFLKRNHRNQKLLYFEKYCLNDLERYINRRNLIIPKVINYFEFKNKEYLVMEWLDIDNINQKKLGIGLAEMHLNSNKNNPNKFGYPIQGFIGTTNQLQGWENNWVDCFLKLRIEPQISLLKNNLIDSDLFNLIISRIKIILSDHEPMNALVHGDLWSGNIGSGNQEKGIIFDPSCWWADSEVDIAMTKLFGGFKPEFYNSYYELVKSKHDLNKRITIYNFYHILNHANMFGGNYINQAKNYIKIILNM